MATTGAQAHGDGQERSAWTSAREVLGPVMDLVTPMALRVAATLRLADLLADGPVEVDTLAERSGWPRC